MNKLFKSFTLLLLSLLLGQSASAQVSINCTPSFDNGCSNWYTRSFSLGNFSWTAPSDCNTSNFTSDTIFLAPDQTFLGTAQSGNWCGIGLWMDFDLSGDYDTSENIFHKYGGSQVHTYELEFTVPDTMPLGVYPMRLVSGWGTDCYTDGDNGYGPCGIYQYGNFQDFVVKVALPTSVSKAKKGTALPLEFRQDGTDQLFIIGSKEVQSLSVYSSEGKLVLKEIVPAEGLSLHISHLPSGIYRFRSEGGNQVRSASWMNRK